MLMTTSLLIIVMDTMFLINAQRALWLNLLYGCVVASSKCDFIECMLAVTLRFIKFMLAVTFGFIEFMQGDNLTFLPIYTGGNHGSCKTSPIENARYCYSASSKNCMFM